MTLYRVELEGGAVGAGDGIGNADDVGRFMGQNALMGLSKFDTAVCRWRSTTQWAEP